MKVISNVNSNNDIEKIDEKPKVIESQIEVNASFLKEVPYVNLISLIVNEDDEVAIIRNAYLQDKSCSAWITTNLMKYNTNAEEAITLDVEEKLGLKVRSVKYLNSFYQNEITLLSLGYVCKVYNDDFQLSDEIEQVTWMNLYDACKKLKTCHDSIFLLKNYLEILEF